MLLLLDQAGADGDGTISRLWLGNERGYTTQDLATLGADDQRRLQYALQCLHSLATSTVRFRMLNRKAAAGRESMAERATLQRALAREALGDQDLSQLLLDLAERLRPHPADEALAYQSVVAALAAVLRPGVTVTSPSAATGTPRPSCCYPPLLSQLRLHASPRLAETLLRAIPRLAHH